MPDLYDLLLHLPGVVPAEECDIIIRSFDELQQRGGAYRESSMDASSGRRVESTFNAVSLPPGSMAFEAAHRRTWTALKAWLDYLEAQGRYNTKLLRRSLRYSHDYRVLRYAMGAQIHPHTDWDEFTLASCTLALNDDYTGGEFGFFNDDRRIRLNRGDALIWPADCFWVHRVTPVKSGIRYGVNSFITSMPEVMKSKVADELNARPKQEWDSVYRHHFVE
ncbi:2OG-Fe(II) oxygenase [Collimonas fungivorans]|nr:2OG-Fe(II) oxygenase [Collimonas fungivorans]